MMKTKHLISTVLFMVGITSHLLAQNGISRTPWEMNRGSGWSWLSSSLTSHGQAPEAYANASIPAESDANWQAAPNGDVIGFSESSIIPGYAYNPTAGYTMSTCLLTVDYTYFQTFVTVPFNTAVTQFTIDFAGIDDGGRITIFNSANPAGIVVPGSYVFLGGTGTSNLADYVVAGENRVIVTQVDDCPTGNNLYQASVVLNGTTVQVGCTPSEQTFTILGANGVVGDIDPYSQSLPAGATVWQPVYLTGWHPWGFIPNTNSWVNFDPNNTVGLNTRTPYRIRFEVPADFTNASMTFNLKADNRAIIYINDTFIDSVDGQGSPSIDATIADQALHPGLNEIRLTMVDWGGIVGFNYRIDVTMTSCENIADAVLTPDEAAVLNNPPVANAGADQALEVASATLDGSASSDPDGNLLSYSWSLDGTEIATGANPTISLADGSYTIVLTVSDGELSDTDEVNIVVATNQPPVADAGDDQSFDCIIGGTAVTLDGSASSDPDGDALSYSWTLDGNEVSTTAAFTDSLGGGVYAFILTVSDGQASSSDTVSVTINLDDEAPVITLAGANPDSVVCLYGYTDPGASVADNCDAGPVMTVVDSVDTSAVGSYSITYTAVDESGNSSSVVRTVNVINHPPVVDNPVGEVVLSYGTSILSTSIDLSTVFSDPDAHLLSYSAEIADNSVAGIALSGDSLTVSLVALGSTTVTVTAADGCGGTVQDVFTVTINVTADLTDAVLFSVSKTELKRSIDVTSGNVIVNEAASASNDDDDDDHHGDNHGGHGDDDHGNQPSYELVIGRDVTTPAGYSLRANGIKIDRQGSISGDAYYNTLSSSSTINGSEYSPLATPQFVNLPPLADASPGTQDISVRRNQPQTLAAGDYDKIEVKERGELTLSGGVYNVRELELKERAKILCAAGVEIRISEELELDERSSIGSTADGNVAASQIVIIVSGNGGGHGHGHDDHNEVKLGQNSTVSANLFALGRQLTVKQGADLTGAFWAQSIKVENDVTLTLDSRYAITGGGSMAKSTLSDSPDDQVAGLPTTMALQQNYPNPFNPTTTISYSLPQASTISLKVYDIRGRLVESLVEGYQTAGYHRVQFGNNQLSSGTYLYVLQAGDFREVKRMVFLK